MTQTLLRPPTTQPFVLRQSDLKTWAKCPLQYKFDKIDALPRVQSGSLTFGSLIHHFVQMLEEGMPLQEAVAGFTEAWLDPVSFDPQYRVDYYVRGTDFRSFLAEGPRILTEWAALYAWDADVVLAREYSFDVGIGDGHVLHGTIDKLALRYRADIDAMVLMAIDYKTTRKMPTYDWLADDLQFTAYLYASTRPEFWTSLSEAAGEDLHARYAPLRRYGEWVQLTGPRRRDADERDAQDFGRLELAADALAASVAMRIFVPNISGESCRWCDYRAVCGLKPVPED